MRLSVTSEPSVPHPPKGIINGIKGAWTPHLCYYVICGRSLTLSPNTSYCRPIDIKNNKILKIIFFPCANSLILKVNPDKLEIDIERTKCGTSYINLPFIDTAPSGR